LNERVVAEQQFEIQVEKVDDQLTARGTSGGSDQLDALDIDSQGRGHGSSARALDWCSGHILGSDFTSNLCDGLEQIAPSLYRVIPYSQN
jgi:hypothetical protein